MVQSMINLEDDINKKVLDYANEKSISKYEAIVELIKDYVAMGNNRIQQEILPLFARGKEGVK